MTQILETRRLLLQTVEENDLKAFLELFSDPITMQYFPSVKDEAGVAEWINSVRGRYVTDEISFSLSR
jgi:RimJ/RimL family protein N-acetyltransferase